MHTTRIRVRYGETDRMGVVYHANYLVYFEIGRTELIRALGRPYSDLERDGQALVVVEADLRFRSPARYDDELLVETNLAEVTRASVRFTYRVLHAAEERLVALGSTTLASVGPSGKPRRFPSDFRQALLGALEPGEE